MSPVPTASRVAREGLLALLVLISMDCTIPFASLRGDELRGTEQTPASPAAAPVDADELRKRAVGLVAEQGQLCAAGQLAAAEEKGKRALTLFAQLGDLYGQADTEAALGLCSIKTSRGEAREHFKTSLDLYEKLGDRIGSWSVLAMLGMAESLGANADPAEQDLRRALAVLDKARTEEGPLRLESFKVFGNLQGIAPFDPGSIPPAAHRLLLLPIFEAMTRAALAQPLIQKEKFGEAEAELRQALTLSRSLGGMLDYTFLGMLGQLQRGRWRLDEAAQSLRGALASLDNIEKLLPAGVKPPPLIRFRLLSQLQEVELLRGRSAEALLWNDRARDFARQAGDLKFEVWALRDRAVLYTGLGDLRQAAAPLAEAARLAERVEDRELRAVVWIDRATQALNVGRYEDAARWLSGEAMPLLQRLEAPDVEAAAQLVLAQAYTLLGAPERARSTLERSLDLARRSGSPDIEIFALMLASRLQEHVSLPQLPEARASIGNLVQVDLRSSSPMHLLLQLMALDLLGNRQDRAPACQEDRAQLARRAIEVAEARGFPFYAAVARLPIAWCYAQRGEVEKAHREMETALAAIAKSGQEDFAALGRAGVAAILWKLGRREEALANSADSLAAYEKLAARVQTDELLAAFFGGDRSLPFQVMVDMLAQTGRTRDAFEYAEKARGRALLRLLENQRLRAAPGTDSALLARADELRQQILRQERLMPTSIREAAASMQAEVDNLHRELEDLLLRIRLVDPEYAELVGEKPANVEAIQQALEPGTALISYFLPPKGGMAWVIDRDNVHWVSLPLEKDDLEAVRCMSERIVRGRTPRSPLPLSQSGGCKPWETLSVDLYQKLIAPLALRHQRLILIPHGVLHGLPFAALRNPRTGRYLIEEYCLSFAPSASIVPLLHSRRSAAAGRALVLGNPASAEPGLSRLEWAEEEARQVAHLLGTEPLVGAAVTEGRLRDELIQGADLLHIAAHGVFLPNHPRFSYLALAADPGKEGHLYDGRLEMDEVFAGLDLTKVHLVVLSACDTAQGQRTEGDEVLGLVRSFLYAGSAGVLATLWNVDDAASARLMVTFYRRLREGARPAEALQQAQIEMLHDSGHQDPFFWAAYQLTGDPGATVETPPLKP